MTGVPVDVTPEPSGQPAAEEAPPRERRRRPPEADVEIEREITKRHLIEAITSVVVVILYMAFTLLRDRDAGVVVIDPEDEGPEDDWQEA